MNKANIGVAVLAALLLSAPAYSDDAAEEQVEQVDEAIIRDQSIDLPGRIADDVDPRDWGIRNGCINVRRIDNVDFLDDQVALVEMKSDKVILMQLRRRCLGIKNEGFVYDVRGGELCARFDSVKVLRRIGASCQIESFEPFVVLDTAAESDDNQNDNTTEK